MGFDDETQDIAGRWNSRARRWRIALSCGSGPVAAAEVFAVTHTDEEWHHLLTPAQYNVLREQGTEAAGIEPAARRASRPAPFPVPAATSALLLGDQVRKRHGLAELLEAAGRRGQDRSGYQLHGAHGGPLRAMRRASGPCLRRRPSAHGPALLHERRGAPVSTPPIQFLPSALAVRRRAALSIAGRAALSIRSSAATREPAPELRSGRKGLADCRQSRFTMQAASWLMQSTGKAAKVGAADQAARAARHCRRSRHRDGGMSPRDPRQEPGPGQTCSGGPRHRAGPGRQARLRAALPRSRPVRPVKWPFPEPRSPGAARLPALAR